jgi:hypothetical protein
MPELTQDEAQAAPELFFAKTHHLPEEDKLPAVYLVRDGRDALVSYAHYVLHHDRGIAPEEVDPQQFRQTLHDLILETRSPFGTWGSNVDAWMDREDVVTLRFEEFVRDPVAESRRAFAALRLPIAWNGQSPPTFGELHEKSPTFFRRGRIGGWQDEFPADLLPLFWEKFGSQMRRLGYDRAAARAG